MKKIYGIINNNSIKNEIDPRIYGGFVEHMGRGIYGGIFEEYSGKSEGIKANEKVTSYIKDLGVTAIRYPGGNFVSGYDWRDGIGSLESRPVKYDLAWQSIEPNLIGLDEFMKWSNNNGHELMYAVNLGTLGVKEALEVLEYSNIQNGTYWSDKRIKNGSIEPYSIKTWCLGNEMDGPWQIGQKSAEDYGKIARETAKTMKLLDEDIELIVCGSSYPEMPTFGEWEYKVLQETYEYVDYISIHQYYGNYSDDILEYLAESDRMDSFIKTVTHICDLVKQHGKHKKQINIAFDEWNVWYHTLETDKDIPKWKVGRPVLEDIYTFEDALLVGGLLITLLKNSDRVKIACLAQLVNVIAPIMVTDNKVWRQPTYFTFSEVAKFGHGNLVDLNLNGPSYKLSDDRVIPFVDGTSVISDDQISIFILNRDNKDEQEINLDFDINGDYKLEYFSELVGYDLKQTNQKQETVVTTSRSEKEIKIKDNEITFTVKPLSWNVVVLKK